MVAGGVQSEQARRPTLASLAKQMSVLRAQDATLRRRIAAVAKLPGPPGSPGPQGVQGIAGPVGAHLIRTTQVLADGSPVTTLVNLPGLGKITAACANGATTAQVGFDSNGGPAVDLYQHQIRASTVFASGGRSTGMGFVQVAMPWQWTVQLAGTSGAAPPQALVQVAAISVPGPSCGISVFGWATD